MKQAQPAANGGGTPVLALQRLAVAGRWLQSNSNGLSSDSHEIWSAPASASSGPGSPSMSTTPRTRTRARSRSYVDLNGDGDAPTRVSRAPDDAAPTRSSARSTGGGVDGSTPASRSRPTCGWVSTTHRDRLPDRLRGRHRQRPGRRGSIGLRRPSASGLSRAGRRSGARSSAPRARRARPAAPSRSQALDQLEPVLAELAFLVVAGDVVVEERVVVRRVVDDLVAGPRGARTVADGGGWRAGAAGGRSRRRRCAAGAGAAWASSWRPGPTTEGREGAVVRRHDQQPAGADDAAKPRRRMPRSSWSSDVDDVEGRRRRRRRAGLVGAQVAQVAHGRSSPPGQARRRG